MQTIQMPFAGGMGQYMRSDEDKATLLRELGACCGLNVMQRQYMRYSDAMAPALRRMDRYVACLQSNGARYILYLTRHGFAGICALVDRRVTPGHFYPKVLLVHIAFDDALFDGTVFDCELVREEHGTTPHRWVLLVGDLLAQAGRSLIPIGKQYTGGCPLVERLSRAQSIICTQHRRDDSDLFEVRIKRYFPVQRLRDALSSCALERLGHPVRGVCFKPLRPCYGRDMAFTFDARTAVTQTSAPLTKPRSARVHVAPRAQHPTSQACPVDAAPKECVGDAEHTLPTAQRDPPSPRTESLPTLTPTMFYVARTALPDVYELHRTADAAVASHASASEVEIAGVPSMADSRALAAAVPPPRRVSACSIPFVRHPRLNRWVLQQHGMPTHE
jgi:hypothetical protein